MSRCCNSAVSMKNPNTFLPTSFTIDFPFHISKIMVVSILELGSFFQVKRKNRQREANLLLDTLLSILERIISLKTFYVSYCPNTCPLAGPWYRLQGSNLSFLF